MKARKCASLMMAVELRSRTTDLEMEFFVLGKGYWTLRVLIAPALLWSDMTCLVGMDELCGSYWP